MAHPTRTGKVHVSPSASRALTGRRLKALASLVAGAVSLAFVVGLLHPPFLAWLLGATS